MAVIIQIRGDDAAVWTAVNPILAEREFAYETDTKRMKAGDGTTPWNSLPYFETIRQLERIPVTVSGGVLTLDMANAHERKFEVAAAQASNFTIAFANVTNARFISLTIPITGVAITISFPTNVVSRRSDGRWSNVSKTFTVAAVGTGDLFELSWNVLPGPLYILAASEANFPA
jgi:hypothetical protein